MTKIYTINPMITIRHLKADDYGAYAFLREKALETDPKSFGASNTQEQPYRKSRFTDAIENDNHFIVGAFHEDIIVGVTGFKRESALKRAHIGLVWGVYVSVKYRGGGIGRKLVERALKDGFANEEIEQINLSVGAYNTNAHKLYSDLGFVDWGKEYHALKIGDEYVDEIYMVKPRPQQDLSEES